MSLDQQSYHECPICDWSSKSVKGGKNSYYCENCKKTFDLNDYVKVSFEFRGKSSDKLLHMDEAWEVAQALKRMYQELLHPFMERHRQDEPEMLQGFCKIRRPLNEVGIDPR